MIAIIDYNAGNIGSVKNALKRSGIDCVVTSDAGEILSAKGVIFPGQGRAGSAMNALKKKEIHSVIPKITAPFLGICLGMHLLAEVSEEDETGCLSIIPGKCRKLPSDFKIPHIGWNRAGFIQDSPLAKGIKSGDYFYFVHSYYFDALPESVVWKTSYGIDFPSFVQKNNFFAVQFHPEKSGKNGLQFLKNFYDLC